MRSDKNRRTSVQSEAAHHTSLALDVTVYIVAMDTHTRTVTSHKMTSTACVRTVTAHMNPFEPTTIEHKKCQKQLHEWFSHLEFNIDY